MPDLLLSLKALVFLFGAVWMSMIARYTVQLFIDWSKEPWERAKAEGVRRIKLTALANTVGNAHQYCTQMASDLEGIPLGSDTIDDRLRSAAIERAYLSVIPTFNLDRAILEQNATEVFTILPEKSANDVMTTRLEILHVHRRVDALASMFLGGTGAANVSDVQREFIGGTRALLASTIARCANTRTMLETARNSISAIPKRNLRPLAVMAVLLACLGAFAWSADFLKDVFPAKKPTAENEEKAHSAEEPRDDPPIAKPIEATPADPKPDGATPKPGTAEEPKKE